MRAALAQHRAHRPAGVAVQLEVLPQPMHERLDFLRAVQAREHAELGRRQAEVLAPRGAFAQHGAEKI
ncbi:MAG: hypothetical protein A3G28_05955 [Betaproteobacteria bacterium RIFCSPLOWO2_12_FULL_68_19]|nr:MAG: hypothetical protein A3G28_05955 [Betaproteobacteria bacterium RIFCSPLOWO2_12_FULL_68_19]